MMIELQSTYLVLKRWNQNPAATKRQIGIWQHWKEEAEDNEPGSKQSSSADLSAILFQLSLTSVHD